MSTDGGKDMKRWIESAGSLELFWHGEDTGGVIDEPQSRHDMNPVIPEAASDESDFFV